MKTTSANPTTKGSNGSSAAAHLSGESAGDRSRDIANQTFDQLSHAVESARATAVPAIEKLTSSAESIAHRGLEMARSGSQQVRDQAYLASERTAGYVRQQPLKAVLIAVGVGALLTLLFSGGKTSERRGRH